LKQQDDSNNNVIRYIAILQNTGFISGKERAIIDSVRCSPTHYTTHKELMLYLCSFLCSGYKSVYYPLVALRKKKLITGNEINYKRLEMRATAIIANFTIEHPRMSKKDFGDLYILHTPELFHYLLSKHINKDIAEDILQTSMLKAWEHIDTYQKGTNFRAWIFAILRNTMYDFCKRKTPYRYDEDRDDNHKIDSQLNTSGDDSLAGICVDKYLDVLPADYAEILMLAIHAIPYKDISILVGVPVGTIKSRIYRAKALIMSAIDKEKVTSLHSFL
jgi:RNA polymerase sigma-70 factor, ECF subfamily